MIKKASKDKRQSEPGKSVTNTQDEGAVGADIQVESINEI